MTLKTIFAKPVDRPIEGVIKADDEASLHLEVEEYVLTNEVAKCLETFLHAYNHYEGANGVWISGFFGSGKSHLLKMLALLLETARSKVSRRSIGSCPNALITQFFELNSNGQSAFPQKVSCSISTKKPTSSAKPRSTPCFPFSSKSSTRCAVTMVSRDT